MLIKIFVQRKVNIMASSGKGTRKRSTDSTQAKQRNTPPARPERIILAVRRGTRVSERTCCDECGIEEKPIWRYSKSNLGVVYLCSRCKRIVFDRSFGSLDAMNTRRVVTGQFESNRRKY